MVYLVVILMLTSSSFLPIPEEVTILASGMVAYFGSHPELFPPPHPGAASVKPWTIAFVCFAAALLSDLVVFYLGRHSRHWMRRSSWFRFFSRKSIFKKTETIVRRRGMWVAGVFRFTPGLRFPGHWTCGMLGMSPFKFLLVDGAAALVSIPTQVLLVAYYGDSIFYYLKEFKFFLAIVLLVGVAVVLARRSRIPRAE